MATEKGSRLDLTMVGDWGTANFHTIWGWVSAHLRWRSAPLSKFNIRTADYGIKIPSVVAGKIAESIEVTVNSQLSPAGQ